MVFGRVTKFEKEEKILTHTKIHFVAVNIPNIPIAGYKSMLRIVAEPVFLKRGFKQMKKEKVIMS